MTTPAEQANLQLVDQLIAQGALWSAPLIKAFRTTPRHRFLPRVWHYAPQHGGWHEIHTAAPSRQELRLIYSDRALTTRLSESSPGQLPVPISSSSQPSLMSEMLEELCLQPGFTVLEIGAGTGYNAALLAQVAGRVVSVEIDPHVLAEAAEHLRAFPDRRVELHQGDGRVGCPEAAPFDRILVTAAALDLEPAWLEQLAEGGLLLVPLDLAPGLAYLWCGSCRAGVLEGRLTRPAYFMPLRDNSAAEDVHPHEAAELLPAAEMLPTVSAPWADWFDRKSSCAGPGLLPSLAFLGWLQGYTIGFQTLAQGQLVYGIGDPAHGHACWLGKREWRVTGMAGRNLGARLWCDFLDAGGPWPTEFRLQAVPADTPSRSDLEADSDCVLAHARHGPRCRQLWTLPASRQRPAWS